MDDETYGDLQRSARDHLWMHFTRHSSYENADVPIIVKGEGVYIWDAKGNKYLDALAGLFVSQLGHGREDLAEAAARQARELAFFPLWSYAHPNAIELADRIAGLAPGDLNRVFFTTGGGEAVETAWKLAKNYFKLTGKPMKHKVISRAIAYHGTPQGALSITGLPPMKAPFEPLVPSTFRVPNTNFYRASELGSPHHHGESERGTPRGAGAPEGTSLEVFGRWAADQIAVAIENEGADTVAAVFLEPVQNSGGCFPPPPGYFQRVREICDEYDVLLVSDEVICAFGRLGHYFGAERYDYQPDMITFAKGITSGYAPLGGMIATDALMEPFLKGTESFLHGYTFGGHPVSTAVALANLDAFESEGINKHVRENEGAFRSTLEKLYDLPIVGDVRGDGYFYGIELVKDKATKETFDDAESEKLLRGFLSKALYDAGLYCRADDRGDPVVQLAPPLICDQPHFDEMEQKLRDVLSRASDML
jgi:adenosylmethionine-8-amino-7-oxononanoate aminotransferase